LLFCLTCFDLAVLNIAFTNTHFNPALNIID
jgi:hypothetical protein